MKIVQHQAPLEILKGPGRIYTLGTHTRTLAGIMAAEDAGGRSCYCLSLLASPIACICVVSLGRGQRHGTKITDIGCQGGTRGHAATALDAVGELKIILQLLGRLVKLPCRVVDFRFIGAKDIGPDGTVLLKHAEEIGNEIADNREVRQRPDREVRLRNVQNLGIAGQARLSIEKHSAGTADAHAAGVSPRQSGVEFLLDKVQAVDHLWDAG